MAGREATANHPEVHVRTRPMPMRRIVRSLEELALLPRDSAVNGLVRRSAIELAIPGLPIHAQLYAQLRLNALQRRCGCVAGSIATIAGLFAGGLRIAGRDAPAWSLATLGLCVLCVIVSLALGLAVKLGTLALTQWQFAHSCRAQRGYLETLLRTQPAIRKD